MIFWYVAEPLLVSQNMHRKVYVVLLFFLQDGTEHTHKDFAPVPGWAQIASFGWDENITFYKLLKISIVTARKKY